MRQKLKILYIKAAVIITMIWVVAMITIACIDKSNNTALILAIKSISIFVHITCVIPLFILAISYTINKKL